ncbi:MULTISPECIES: DUF3035 domain-containing protein [unclassified Sphingomonas]|uniref:DUF3035 domain-containing protein n=1 Tax=unclassified Sphingomonas TaxID=196159 RepID=UPI001D11C175|nr:MULTISPECIES: DUF3035 domain-containing protein [unclassified Sphingomonas]MCC2979830.1 DUF3035 domain-containing protein [Sphingomonas sp. IC4-52]MCD2314591.1 DUF3035 domain-containing protein [Sphingomonas sp. IC-11]
MRKSIVMGAGLAVLLAGCASNGLNRDRPDEFAVARQPSLIIPPDFALVPPTPGAARVQSATSAQAQTLEALFGSAPRSAGETAALQAAGEQSADRGIRSSAGDPQTNVIDKGQTTRDIIAAPEGDGQEARANAPR